MTYFYADDDDDSLPPNRLCFVNKDFNTPFSCSITRILKNKIKNFYFNVQTFFFKQTRSRRTSFS